MKTYQFHTSVLLLCMLPFVIFVNKRENAVKRYLCRVTDMITAGYVSYSSVSILSVTKNLTVKLNKQHNSDNWKQEFHLKI